MKQLLALLLALMVGLSNADTTSNVLNGANWVGVTNGNLPAGRMPGYALLYDASTGTVHWSYSDATAAKTIAINNALSGTGVQVSGYNYNYDLRNMNGDDRQGNIDTMTVVTRMTSNTGSTLLSNTNTHNTKFDWTTFSGTQTLSNSAALSNLGNLSISFTSRDSGYWGGYFGPEVRNVGMSLNYTSDPCSTNPAYSPTCSNYNTVSTSDNLLTGMSGTQAYAVNQALSAAGAGVTIHGFDYGYTYSTAGRSCSIWDIWGACLTGWNYSSAGVDTVITNSAETPIYSDSTTHNGGSSGTSGSYSKEHRFSTSVPAATIGTFRMTPWTSGNASIGNMYSKAVYTTDPCVSDPLSSMSCPNYQQAYHDQQCSYNPLYAVDCAGYAVAYMTQQCSYNSLYSTQCPGYQQAYHDQQCSTDPLYATTCTGYATAYHDQQCYSNALYATDCPGYATAYKTQQCSMSALYATDCPGYEAAYLRDQCIRDSLYSTQCEGYKTAYAIKYLVNLSPSVTSAVNQQLTTTVETQKADPTNVVSSTGDSTVDSVVAAPSTTSVTSTTSPTSVTAPKENSATNSTTNAPAPPPPAASKQDDKQEKKTDSQMASMEKKSGGNKENAKKEAGEKGKQLANEIASATSIEQQQAIQGSLVGVMNFVPGFSSYSTALIPDTNGLKMSKQYNKPVIDNLSAQRRMSGASDSKWQAMVDSQFNLGK